MSFKEEKTTLCYADIIELHEASLTVLGGYTPLKRNVIDTVNGLDEVITEFKNSQKTIVEKYAEKDDKGNLVLHDPTKAPTLNNFKIEDPKAFAKELDDLLFNTFKEITIIKVDKEFVIVTNSAEYTLEYFLEHSPEVSPAVYAAITKYYI